MERILDLIYPSKNICHLCKSEIEYKNNICINCMEKLDIINGRTDTIEYIDEVYYALFYNRFIKDKIRDFKFHNKPYLYKSFGGLMTECLRYWNIRDDIDYVIYIPSHRIKKARRGYNQSVLLSKYISKGINKELMYDNLIKIKNTKNQSDLNKLERHKNLKDSFYIKHPENLLNKNILLVDDIITTGSTFSSVGKILKDNGVNNILAIALASTKNY